MKKMNKKLILIMTKQVEGLLYVGTGSGDKQKEKVSETKS
jgi:hypothetical protein